MASRAVETDSTAEPITRRALQAAINLNLITPADVVHGRALVHALGDSGRVSLIQCDNRCWVATHAGGQGTVEGDWRAELAAYRSAPALDDRNLVPGLVAYDGDNHLLITQALEHNWSRLDRSDIRSPWSVEVFARVATSLARWHQASQSLTTIEPATPWLLVALQGDPPEASSPSADLDELLTRILGDAFLRSYLEEIANSWASAHVMHGDLRLANVMVHTDGSIRLIDWRASGWGDPRWDLAGLLQELRSTEIQQGIDTSAHRAAVLDAYAERATSPTALDEHDPTLQAFVAGRLIVRALDLQRRPEGTDELVDAHLHAARSVRPSR